jgi:AcrR family transcriptional regulator
MRDQFHDERRRAIVAAARDLFLKKGFEATGMLDIARKAGLASGTLYNYFASKTALLVELFRMELADSPAGPELSTIRAWVRFGFERYARFPRDRWRSFMRGLYEDDTGRDAEAWASQGDFRAALTALVAGRLGEDRTEESERLAGILFAVFFQAFLRWVHVGGAIEAFAASVEADFEYLLSASARSG